MTNHWLVELTRKKMKMVALQIVLDLKKTFLFNDEKYPNQEDPPPIAVK